MLFRVSVPSVAQETSGECQDALAAAPFSDMLTKNDGHDFAQLHARSQGTPLIGLSCSLEVLVEYFEAAGWELTVSRSYEPIGPAGNEFAHYSDRSVGFCIKGSRLTTWYLRKCLNAVGFNFFEGKISFNRAGGRG